MCKSVRQMPQAWTRSSTCPAPGVGVGISVSSSGCFGALRTIARIGLHLRIYERVSYYIMICPFLRNGAARCADLSDLISLRRGILTVGSNGASVRHGAGANAMRRLSSVLVSLLAVTLVLTACGGSGSSDTVTKITVGYIPVM